MKLGTQTGSLMNHLMANGTHKAQIGKGATILQWTDRHAYFVNFVSANGKRALIERAKAVRIDDNGMSDSQDYKYERMENADIREVVFKWGKWRMEYTCPYENKKKYQPINIAWGVMQEYYDYSF